MENGGKKGRSPARCHPREGGDLLSTSAKGRGGLYSLRSRSLASKSPPQGVTIPNAFINIPFILSSPRRRGSLFLFKLLWTYSLWRKNRRCEFNVEFSSYSVVRNRQNFKNHRNKANTHVQKWAWVVCAYCGMALPSL